MSDQLLCFFLTDNDVRRDAEGEQKLTYKIVMRTGTWKLRPGPGGVKLDAPLKIYRDKAPKGHISLSALKRNFEAGAKENVTFPTVHADGTISDSGFVRKLIIEDVKDDKGKVVESKLWAGMDITDSVVKRKVDEKSLVGCSGGVLFDYQRTRDGKKFDQVLSHVMGTNSPWIDGCDGYKDKLPNTVMAADEAHNMNFGELEQVEDEDPVVEHPAPPEDVKLDDPVGKNNEAERAPEGTVVWKPDDGYRRTQHLVQKSLDEWRRALLARFRDPISGKNLLDYEDVPYLRCDDVTRVGDKGTALIRSGYGDDKDCWVANFTIEDEVASVTPFENWTPAKQEWVAASEEQTAPSAGRPRMATTPLSPPPAAGETDLRRAQNARLSHQTRSHTQPGGPMNLSDLLASAGVELSDEARNKIALAQKEQDEKDARYANIEKGLQKTRLDAFLSQLDKLDPSGLHLATPAVKKYVKDVCLSDDGGAALMFSETTESGAKTEGVQMSASDIIDGLLKALPIGEDGRLKLSESSQVKKLPGDAKEKRVPEDGEEDKSTPDERAQALLEEDPLLASFVGGAAKKAAA